MKVADYEKSLEEVDFSSSLKVQIIPFFVNENKTAQYAITLGTEPTAIVTVQTVIILEDDAAFVSKPVLRVTPSYLVFSRSNWSIHQRIALQHVGDDVYHASQRFTIRHRVVSDDTIFATKTNETVRVVVDIMDDDKVGIQLEKPGASLSIRAGGTGKKIKIKGLTSKPEHSVAVYVDITDGSVKPDVGSDPIPIAKEQWGTFEREITFNALKNVVPGKKVVTLRTVSNDLNYNKTDMLVLDVTAVPNTNPETDITRKPAKISAVYEDIHFTFSSNDANVQNFQYKFDYGDTCSSDFCSIDDCSSHTCNLTISFLRYGAHRVEVRAVRNSDDAFDETPAVYSWTIAHCNGFSPSGKTQYADIDNNGALTCVVCPHEQGANCTKDDGTWDDVIAKEEWWTSGTRKDTFLKCPYRNACIGGDFGPNISTIKSRCALGYNQTGTFCAVCAKHYYLSSGLCLHCPAAGDPETGAFLVFLYYAAFFVPLFLMLLNQMRVKTTEHYWMAMRDEAAHKKRKKKMDRKTVKKIRLFVGFVKTTLKTFVTYLQILSVTNTAFRIDWPPGFLNFLSVLIPIQFDLFAISGMACIRPYSFYDSHQFTMAAPIVLAFLIFVTYQSGLRCHKRHYGEHFTKGMGTSYGNHVIQFAMWVTIILYPTISSRAIQYFNCSEEIDGRHYLVSDYSEACYDEKWEANLVFGVLGVLAYPLGIPAFFGWSLWSRRHRLDETDVAHRYGFLYEMYRRENYWWDVYEMLQKLFLTGVIVLIFPKSELQVVIAVLADLCFLMNLLIQKPHVAGPTRNLAMMGNMAITMTMYCGLVLTSVKGTEEHQLLFDFVLVLMNGTVAAYAGYHVLPCRICHIMSKGKREAEAERKAAEAEEAHAKRKSIVGGESETERTAFVANVISGKRLTEIVPASSAHEDVSLPGKHDDGFV